jgi:cytoplasmic iron level regulating protein YaaA (DUF328/UPF0246 family)
MSDYTILLPPSEGKASGGEPGPSWLDLAADPAVNAFCTLNPQRGKLIDALHATLANASAAKLQKLFGVKGDALAAALEANDRLPDGPLLPAIERYTGVMFDYIDYATLPTPAREAFDRNVILFSGLWGILRPTDLIPDYKLKMDASLPGIGKLSTFWKKPLSATLNPALGPQVVWDFLPNAHTAAWKPAPGGGPRWQVKFVQRVEKQGKTTYRTVSHWSKALKGALVRFICEHGITAPSAFQDFAHPEGYVFTPGESRMAAHGGRLVFIKS